jgi:hypothetical protein
LTRSEGTAFKGLMREVEMADVKSPVDGATFYSGKLDDGTRMRVFAEQNTDGVSTVTLEQTPDGKDFDGRGLYEPASPVSKDQADQLWGRLSQRYAENRSGQATAWAHEPWSGSIWYTKELPALENNPNITDIKVIDPAP